MKKLILKSMLAVAAIVALASCQDTMDSKSSIDNKYANAAQATETGIVLESVTVNNYKTATFSVTLANTENVTETGVVVATAEDFSDAVYTAYELPEADEEADDSEAAEEEGEEGEDEALLPNKFTMVVQGTREEGLTGGKTYYVAAYAVTKAGGTVLSDITTITTPPIPVLPVSGVYNVNEYKLNDDDELEYSDSYQIVIKQDEDDPELVEIYNFWGFGEWIEAYYDEGEEDGEEYHEVLIPSGTVIGVHSKYGDVSVRGVNPAITAYLSYVIFEYTPLGGYLEEYGYFQARVAAGSFGFYAIEGEQDLTGASAAEVKAKANRAKYMRFVK